MLRPFVRGGALRSHRSHTSRSSIEVSRPQRVRPQSLKAPTFHSARKVSSSYALNESFHSPLTTPFNAVGQERSLPTEQARVHNEEEKELRIVEQPQSDLLRPPRDQRQKGQYNDWDSLHNQIMRSLKADDAQGVLLALSQTAEGSDYLSTIPSTLSIEILEAIDPAKFLDPYTDAYQYRQEPFNNVHESKEGPPLVTDISRSLVRAVRRLIAHWRDTGPSLDVATYKILLRIASVNGDANLAHDIFASMSAEDRDTEVYNLYFAAKCWDNISDPLEHHSLRVTDRSLFLRSPAFFGHKYRHRGYRTGDRGLRAEITSLFNEMVASGIIPNTHTFCQLMIAMGREGDLEGAEQVLKRVWDVDVGQIMAAESDTICFENDLSPDSLRYPNPMALFTIAHVYGSNNQISTALRLVDYVSRKYSLEIDLRTWSELAEWTFVVTYRRTGRTSYSEKRRQRFKEESKGWLSPETFENLWRTMTGEPYNINPTLRMHDMRIRALGRLGRFHEMIDAIHEAAEAFQINSVTQDIYRRRMAELSNFKFDFTQGRALQPHLISILKDIRNGEMLHDWTKLLLVGSEWVNNEYHTRITIPKAIAELEPKWLSPLSLCYSVRDGRVQFSRNRKPKPSPVFVMPLSNTLKSDGRRVQLVRHKQHIFGNPFMEKTRSQRRAEARNRWISQGTHQPKDIPLSWFEKSDVGNWIWLADGEGFRSLDPNDLTIYQ
ncbi:MAG: hypothetical protein MMC23_005510 [Stictis urceolatum]|nr:hypothetical protein [Stictis urceolata]